MFIGTPDPFGRFRRLSRRPGRKGSLGPSPSDGCHSVAIRLPSVAILIVARLRKPASTIEKTLTSQTLSFAYLRVPSPRVTDSNPAGARFFPGTRRGVRLAALQTPGQIVSNLSRSLQESDRVPGRGV